MQKIIKLLYYILSLIDKDYNHWQYGKVQSKIARRHKIYKNVQYVLWEVGEQEHKEDCWINFNKTWWPLFIPFNNNKK